MAMESKFIWRNGELVRARQQACPAAVHGRHLRSAGWLGYVNVPLPAALPVAGAA